MSVRVSEYRGQHTFWFLKCHCDDMKRQIFATCDQIKSSGCIDLSRGYCEVGGGTLEVNCSTTQRERRSGRKRRTKAAALPNVLGGLRGIIAEDGLAAAAPLGILRLPLRT